jgi:hypothetical protein
MMRTTRPSPAEQRRKAQAMSSRAEAAAYLRPDHQESEDHKDAQR